jgi:Skp family chaperone for outer membrane proteins
MPLTRTRVVRAVGVLALASAASGTAFAQAATVAPATVTPQAAKPTKACENARKKVAREQRTMGEVADALARAQKARATCTSRSACARYDEAIRDTERRQSRQETRLARFGREVAAACPN